MECPHCGAKNAFRAKFCRRCAQRLEMKSAAASNAPGLADGAVTVPVAASRKSNTVILLVLLALVIAGWYFLRPETGESESSAATSAPAPSVGNAPSPSSPATDKPIDKATVAEATSQPDAPARAGPRPVATPHSAGPVEKPAQKAKPVRKPKPAPSKVAEPKPEPARVPSAPEPASVIALSPPKAGLAAELEACNSRAFLARAVCLEQARWKYCQGRWGKTPDCPNPAANDGGG